MKSACWRKIEMGSGVKFGFRAAPFLCDKPGRRQAAAWLCAGGRFPAAWLCAGGRFPAAWRALRGRILMERARCGKIFSDIE